MSDKKVHVSEEGDGDSGTTFRGRECEQKVRTKIGDDGVEETHVDVTIRRPTKYFFGGTDFGNKK